MITKLSQHKEGYIYYIVLISRCVDMGYDIPVLTSLYYKCIVVQ